MEEISLGFVRSRVRGESRFRIQRLDFQNLSLKCLLYKYRCILGDNRVKYFNQEICNYDVENIEGNEIKVVFGKIRFFFKYVFKKMKKEES